MRLSGLRDELEPFGISKLASRIFFTELAGGGDARDASLGADGPTAGDATARCPRIRRQQAYDALGTLPAPSSVSVVMAAAAAGETAAKRWSKDSKAGLEQKTLVKGKAPVEGKTIVDGHALPHGHRWVGPPVRLLDRRQERDIRFQARHLYVRTVRHLRPQGGRDVKTLRMDGSEKGKACKSSARSSAAAEAIWPPARWEDKARRQIRQ